MKYQVEYKQIYIKLFREIINYNHINQIKQLKIFIKMKFNILNKKIIYLNLKQKIYKYYKKIII